MSLPTVADDCNDGMASGSCTVRRAPFSASKCSRWMSYGRLTKLRSSTKRVGDSLARFNAHLEGTSGLLRRGACCSRTGPGPLSELSGAQPGLFRLVPWLLAPALAAATARGGPTASRVRVRGAKHLLPRKFGLDLVAPSARVDRSGLALLLRKGAEVVGMDNPAAHQTRGHFGDRSRLPAEVLAFRRGSRAARGLTARHPQVRTSTVQGFTEGAVAAKL
jgi:hypothetical protein